MAERQTEMTDDEREAERLLKESGPLRERHQILMSAITMDRRVRRGETPDPVTVDEATISYDGSRPGTGIVIRDFLGREHRLEEWLPIGEPPTGPDPQSQG
jgi:hypothetical protein